MLKKIVAMLACLCISLQSLPLVSYAEALPSPAQTATEAVSADPADATLLTHKTVNDILAQHKFTANQGHGFAAERGNTMADQITGKNARVVGDNNAKNGPDRLILERDGTKIWIQDKYYKSAKEGINACFDENGQFRYMLDGEPMQIEVPKDQYAEAVEYMRQKISEGKIEGVTDPNEAETLVRKGTLTYQQAKNLAKAGTLESLTYDAVNGTVTATCAFGISTAINYAVYRSSGKSPEEALKLSVEEGLKTGGYVFCASVIASQLSKTGIMEVFVPSSEALVSAFGDKFAKGLIRASRNQVTQVTTATLTKEAARFLRTEALTAAVTIVVFAIPDAIDMFNGRISQKQFIKNFSVMAVVVVAGTVGSIAGGTVGSLIVPGVGTIPGSIVGSILIGGIASVGAEKIADYITDDDADEMFQLVQSSFAEKCEEYMVNEDEAQHIIDQLSERLTEDLYKDMYQSKEREQFADEMLTQLFEEETKQRDTISLPDEEEMRSALKAKLADVAYIH